MFALNMKNNINFLSSLNNLFYELKKRNLVKSYNELSKKLDVSSSLISSWLVGRSQIPLVKFLEISKLFNVDIIFKNGTFSFSFFDESEKISSDIQKYIDHIIELSKKHPDQIESLLSSLYFFSEKE